MKQNKKLRSTYLYEDGHAVLIYKKHDPEAGEIEFAEVIEQATKAHLSFKGRISFNPYSGSALLKLAKEARAIRVSAPSLESGSENTREKGIAIGNLTFDFPDGSCIYFHDIPSLISGIYHYSADISEVFDPNARRWGGVHIAKIHRKPQPPVALQLAIA